MIRLDRYRLVALTVNEFDEFPLDIFGLMTIHGKDENFDLK